MNIEKYISDLLYRYQCVTIPGFGAFLTEFKSAQINTTSNVMSPPNKSLSFNYLLQNNDGLLANHIALEEKISYSEAVVALKSQVENWTLKLELGETLVIENIGELIKNHEGNVMFIPSETVNYNTDSFGLTEIIAPDVIREPEVIVGAEGIQTTLNERFEKIFNPEQTQKTAIEKLFETKELNPVLDAANSITFEDNITPPKKKKNKVAAFVSVTALLALVMGGVYGYKLYNDKLVDEVTLVVQKGVQDKVEKTIQEATFVMSNPIDAVEIKVNDNSSVDHVETNKTSSLPYHIVAGSFKSENNAKNKTKELHDKGYQGASIVGKNQHQLYIVAYKSFSDYNNAVNELKNIQENDNQEAWIFTKK